MEWNIKNPEIDEIHLLNEKIYDNKLLQHPKIKQIDIQHRLTYYDAFTYGNKLDKDDIKMLSNSDISFDKQSLKKLRKMDLTKKCLALSRYDILNYDPFEMKLYFSTGNDPKQSDTQDSWIFKTIEPKNKEDLESMKFELGKPGCDNHIAFLLDKAGLKVINNCKTTYHHHASQERNYTEQERIGNYHTYHILEIE